MLSKVDFTTAKCIVEFGPGDGCITREIIQRMGPNTHLLALEYNPVFIQDFLQFDDSRVHIVNDSAENFGKHLEALGFSEVDFIISSLPFTNFSKPVKEGILDEAIQFLGPEGLYMQYQYSTSAWKLLRKKFRKVRMGFTAINLPPAFVYTCYP